MVQLGPLKQNNCVPHKQIHFGHVKLHGFHVNLFCDFKEWSVPTKIQITYISAAAYPTALNLVSN